MTDTDIRTPRPAEVLSGDRTDKTETYPAAIIQNPFADSYGEPKIDFAFKTKDGDTIFKAGYNWYVHPRNDKKAYQINDFGIGGESGPGYNKLHGDFATDLKGEHRLTFDFDSQAGKATLGSANLTILSDAEKAALLKSSLAKEITFVDFTENRRVEFATKTPKGDYFIVSDNKEAHDYKSFRVFTGKDLHNLREIPVTEVIRYRDGGTTYYKTTEGTLFRPTGMDPDKVTTWTPTGSKEGTKLDVLNRQEVSKQIGADKRIQGVQTWKEFWEEHEKSPEKPKGSDAKKFNRPIESDMQTALDKYTQNTTPVNATATTLPQLQRDQSNSKFV